MATFHGLYSKDVYITNSNLTDLIQSPDLEYIIKEERVINGIPKFSMVHPSGSIHFLKIGGFELRDISRAAFYSATRESRITVTICEIRLNYVFQENIEISGTTGYFSFLYDYIIPFLQSLNEHGSYKSYRQSLALLKLEEENKELKSRLKQLTDKADIESPKAII